MSIYNYGAQKYPQLQNASAADNYGDAILASDFKTRMLDLECNSSLDGDLVVFESNQYLPPDISQPVSLTNSYYPVGYKNMADQVYYDNTNPYNPVGLGRASFNIESTGSRWVMAAIINRTAGTVDLLTITLFDNQ